MPSPSPEPLPLTGERTVPGVAVENYWFRRHEAAYRAVAPLVGGGLLLEAGCGEGYGADLLRRAGAVVVACDLDPWAVGQAAAAYGLPAVRANLVALPIATCTLDAVVSLQVVEHLWDQAGFVRECARVLRPGGRLVLSTPDRRTFPPGNLFHARELDPDELVALVTPQLDVQAVLGLRHGRRLAAWEAEHGDLVAAQLASQPAAWPAALATFVAGVAAGDFVLDERLDGALDLLLLARA